MAVKGTFKDIAFIELLQLMHLARKTGRIEVSFENKWAMIILREGAVWHVEPRGFHGATPEEVIYAIIGLPEATFLFQRVHVLPALERTVHLSMENLLLEGAKRMDEQNSAQAAAPGAPANGGAAPNTKKVLVIKPGAEAKVRYVPQNVKRVLAGINGQRTQAEIAQASGLDAAQANQILTELLAQDILEAIDAVVTPPPAPESQPAVAAGV